MNKIEEIRAALKYATPGPWSVEYKHGNTRIETGAGCTMCDETYYPWVPDNDADWKLIALAPDMARIVLAAEKLADSVEEYVHIQCDTDEMERACIAYHKAVEGGE